MTDSERNNATVVPAPNTRQKNTAFINSYLDFSSYLMRYWERFFFQVIICIIVPTLDLSLGYSLQLEQKVRGKWYFAPAGPMLSNETNFVGIRTCKPSEAGWAVGAGPALPPPTPNTYKQWPCCLLENKEADSELVAVAPLEVPPALNIMWELNPWQHWRVLQYMDCMAPPICVYSQYLENCSYFPVWGKNSCYLYYLISDP